VGEGVGARCALAEKDGLHCTYVVVEFPLVPPHPQFGEARQGAGCDLTFHCWRAEGSHHRCTPAQSVPIQVRRYHSPSKPRKTLFGQNQCSPQYAVVQHQAAVEILAVRKHWHGVCHWCSDGGKNLLLHHCPEGNPYQLGGSPHPPMDRV